MILTPIENTETSLAIEVLREGTITNWKESIIDFYSLGRDKDRAKHNAHETARLQECFYDGRHGKVKMDDDKHKELENTLYKV